MSRTFISVLCDGDFQRNGIIILACIQFCVLVLINIVLNINKFVLRTYCHDKRGCELLVEVEGILMLFMCQEA